MWPISTYDRWVKGLVAAGRLPGDIAEEMNGRLAQRRNTGSRDTQLGGVLILHMTRGARHPPSPSTFFIPRIPAVQCASPGPVGFHLQLQQDSFTIRGAQKNCCSAFLLVHVGMLAVDADENRHGQEQPQDLSHWSMTASHLITIGSP